MSTWHNPYSLNFSEKRARRLQEKLNHLIDVIERDYYLDRERFQILLESHWLSDHMTGGTVVLPDWNLYLFSALNSPSVTHDPLTYEALLAIAAELRH